MGCIKTVRTERIESSDLPCVMSRILFKKDTFTIAIFITDADIPVDPKSENNEKKSFVALGEGLTRLKLGNKVLLSGTWQESPKYKEFQLHITDCRDDVGCGKENIVAYLSSRAIKGIGKKAAAMIYDMFGDACLEILDKDPQQLLKVPGIKEKKLKSIIETYEQNRAFHSLALLLTPFGITYYGVTKVNRTLGEGAAARIRENPYILCQVSGFGFKDADKVARGIGDFSSSTARIEGAIVYVLSQAQISEGHLYLPLVILQNRCCSDKVLNNTPDDHDAIVPEDIRPVVYHMLQDPLKLRGPCRDNETGLRDDDRIYLPNAYTHEKIAAEKIASMLKTPKDEHDYLALVQETEKELGVTLDEKQEQAVIMALACRLSILTGGPGTGKTTTLHVLVKAYSKAFQGKELSLAAPTGRAARRMEEQTGMPASTLHSLLGLKPDSYTDFDAVPCSDELVSADMLIIDESSMIDAQLAAELFHRIVNKTKILFVGDADQLPSVGAGNVLAQMLRVRYIPSIKLERVFRQAEDSIIPVNAKCIREGCNNLTYSASFQLQEYTSEEDGAAYIEGIMSWAVQNGIQEEIQILCPFKNRGETATSHLNGMIRDIVNPHVEDSQEATVGTQLFRVGDKVMQTKNIEGASNGDIGYIKSITDESPDGEQPFSMEVAYSGQDGAAIKYDHEGARDLVLAYATTIHKSQGSEFPIVVMPIYNSMRFFLKRNLLYTSITRAKKQVILVGQKEAINYAISRADTDKRYTSLAQLITLLCGST